MNMAARHDKVTYEKWFIFIVLCMVTMLDFGIIFAFGSMFVDMLEQFDTTRSAASIVQSMLIGVSLSFSIVSGCLITRFGLLKVSLVAAFLVPLGFCVSFFVTKVQYLYFTISIIAGTGISTVHLVSIILIERFFPPRLHPTCFAIQGISVNVAGIVYPLFIEQLLFHYTLHGTFLILGGLLLNGITAPLLLVFKRDELENFNTTKEKSASGNGTKVNKRSKLAEENEDFLEYHNDDASIEVNRDTNDQTDREITCLKRCHFSSIFTIPFMLLILASAVCIPPLNTFLGFTVDIMVSKGFTVSQGMVTFIPFNICSILSKLLPILTKKINHVSTFVLPLTYCVFGIVSQVLMIMTGSYSSMLAAVSCAGVGLGGGFPAMLIVGVKLVDSESWPLASGLLMTVVGLVSTGLGPILGSLRDASGSYDQVLITILITQCAGFVLYSMAFAARHITRRQTTLTGHG